MFRTKNLTLNNTPQELTFLDEVESSYTIVITNTSANKHMLIGDSAVSISSYGIRLEHDSQPLILERMSWTDRLYAISEDPSSTVSCAVMVIERT